MMPPPLVVFVCYRLPSAPAQIALQLQNSNAGSLAKPGVAKDCSALQNADHVDRFVASAADTNGAQFLFQRAGLGGHQISHAGRPGRERATSRGPDGIAIKKKRGTSQTSEPSAPRGLPFLSNISLEYFLGLRDALAVIGSGQIFDGGGNGGVSLQC
jgi:hypothetical protein